LGSMFNTKAGTNQGSVAVTDHLVRRDVAR
jgi:hypothetical protein